MKYFLILSVQKMLNWKFDSKSWNMEWFWEKERESKYSDKVVWTCKFNVEMILSRTRRHAEKPAWHRSQMRHFKNIAGYEGVFVCGPYPHWLILTSRGELRTHPMSIDWSVPCFAAFNNVNCPQGFIYFNRKVKGKHSFCFALLNL